MTEPTREESGAELLTPAECDQLRSAPGTFAEMLQAAARLGAERAMQAPDGDLPEMLAKLPRLRDWYAIGPAQRAEVDSLVGWVRERERERAARVCEQAWPEMYKWWGDAPWRAACDDCAAAIRRGEGYRILKPSDAHCPWCGHNRDKSSVSTIKCADGLHQCQMCGAKWYELPPPPQGGK